MLTKILAIAGWWSVGTARLIRGIKPMFGHKIPLAETDPLESLDRAKTHRTKTHRTTTRDAIFFLEMGCLSLSCSVPVRQPSEFFRCLMKCKTAESPTLPVAEFRSAEL